MLEIRHLSRRFGGLKAVSDLDLAVSSGEFLGIMGPNGAGKTTLLNLLTGYTPPSSGEVLFEGLPIHNLPPFKICRLGIGRTFQVVKPFEEMSIEDNVIAGTLFSSKRRMSVAEGRSRAREPLELTGLWDIRMQLAKTLTIGGKKKLELARALAVQPRLLLLDEVMGGLNSFEVTEISNLLQRIQKAGVTMIMIEHVMEAIMRLTNRVVVLNFGEKLFEGPPQEVIAHPAVVESYLGKPLDAA
jgi:branched-chain amino acid transport system ATP-binding protein